jgi:hypothetical protein
MIPCNFVCGSQYFRGIPCFHLQGINEHNLNVIKEGWKIETRNMGVAIFEVRLHKGVFEEDVTRMIFDGRPFKAAKAKKDEVKWKYSP